jgi:hypothetical protein
VNVERDPVFGCLLWRGRLDADGYGRDGRRKAHIVAWEAEHGAVPEGFELDHECRRRACCFVPHLAAVTRSENLKRRELRHRLRIKKCQRGHDMSDAAITGEGGRLCRTCMKEWQLRGET